MGGKDPRLGTVLAGRYRIEKKVGVGGMATVYSALDRHTGEKVAIKLLSDEFARDKSAIRRFRIEAQAAGSIDHENVVKVHHFGESLGDYFLVMDLIEGVTLAALIKKGPIAAAKVAKLGADISSGLEAIHDKGIVHRDVKPGNVIVNKSGNAMLTDFGIALVDQDLSLTREGSVVGTATYFAPEQAKGRRGDERSDLYSLGVLLYQMTCGKLPFTGNNAVSVAYKHVQEAPPEFDSELEVPDWLNDTIQKLLAKKPMDRIPAAGIVASLLSGRTVKNEDVPQEGEAVFFEPALSTEVDLELDKPIVLAETQESIPVGSFFLEDASAPTTAPPISAVGSSMVEIIPGPQTGSDSGLQKVPDAVEIFVEPDIDLTQRPEPEPVLQVFTDPGIQIAEEIMMSSDSVEVYEETDKSEVIPIGSLMILEDNGENLAPTYASVIPVEENYVDEKPGKRFGGLIKFAAVFSLLTAVATIGFFLLESAGDAPGFAGTDEELRVAEVTVDSTSDTQSLPDDNEVTETTELSAPTTTADGIETTTPASSLTTQGVSSTTDSTVESSSTTSGTTATTTPVTVATTAPTTTLVPSTTASTTTTTIAETFNFTQTVASPGAVCLNQPVVDPFEVAMGAAFGEIGSTDLSSFGLVQFSFQQAGIGLPGGILEQVAVLEQCGYAIRSEVRAANTPGALLYDLDFNGFVNSVGISLGNGSDVLTISNGAIDVVSFDNIQDRFNAAYYVEELGSGLIS